MAVSFRFQEMADLREESVKDEGDLRERIWRIIFLSDTRAGQVFDVMLLLLILASTAGISCRFESRFAALP